MDMGNKLNETGYIITISTVDGKVKAQSTPFEVDILWKVVTPQINQTWHKGLTYPIHLTPDNPSDPCANLQLYGVSGLAVELIDVYSNITVPLFPASPIAKRDWAYTVPATIATSKGYRVKVTAVGGINNGHHIAYSDWFTIE
jgi:hypothetical protein